MKTTFWLIAAENGGVRLTKRAPSMDMGEVAAKMSLEIPDAYFRRPQFTINAVVESTKEQPAEVDIVVAENALRETTGLNLRITSIDSED